MPKVDEFVELVKYQRCRNKARVEHLAQNASVNDGALLVSKAGVVQGPLKLFENSIC